MTRFLEPMMSAVQDSTQPAQIAVLMTCFNRREITLKCLDVLYQQSVDFQVYLVDDGSTDGTQTAIEAKYPAVKVLRGDGSLYWVGGMHMAFEAAIAANHPYYLWLNDDTLIEPGALQTLLETHQKLSAAGHPNSIVAGAIKDPSTGEQTYGGRTRPKRWYSFKFEAVESSQQPQQCDTMQGNIVLIPRSVVEKVGNVDTAFIHNFGDLDYGLRAQRKNCSVWVAPGFAGSCPQNSVKGSYVDTSLSRVARLKKALHIKGFPVKAWTTYLQRHAGPFWFIYWPLPYVRSLIGYRDLKSSPSFTDSEPVT